MRGRLRYNPRDANEPELVALARQLGAEWFEDGPLDGWVWCARMGGWVPVEVKLPEREGLASEYTPKQVRFLSRCQAIGARWWVWRTQADVLRDLGARVSA